MYSLPGTELNIIRSNIRNNKHGGSTTKLSRVERKAPRLQKTYS